jgi:hypothetical protein
MVPSLVCPAKLRKEFNSSDIQGFFVYKTIPARY